MLAYVLALVIGLGSLAVYMAAFFFPEVHRKEDFIWSGVGLFYALVLWVCAGRITGGVLLGQMASVALLGWFGWQTLTLRRELTAPESRTAISPEVAGKLQGFSLTGVGQTLQQQFKKKQPDAPNPPASPATTTTKQEKSAPSESTPVVNTATADVTEAVTPTTPATPTQETAATTLIAAPETEVSEPVAEKTETVASPELVPPNPPAPELVEAAQTTESTQEETLPIEEIAPDAELAPPAEPPSARQIPPEA